MPFERELRSILFIAVFIGTLKIFLHREMAEVSKNKDNYYKLIVN